VDDNLATLDQGKSLLQAFYKVYTVQTAATLFENLEFDIPDLILLDVEMPEMDGFETIAKLKADSRYKDIPVIFLTSKSDEESERKGFSLGAVDYITKPFSGPLLQKRISNQILYMRVQNAVKDYSNDLEIMVGELAKANERTKVLMEKTPFCARLWNSSFEMIDCNEATLSLFGFKDKFECLEKCFDLYPEKQPDGHRSIDKMRRFHKKAFKEGVCEFEWVYRMLDGTPMPAVVILVRVDYDDGYAVAEYIRDMREHHNMLRDIEYRNVLLQAVNKAATHLLNSDVDTFEKALYESTKELAEAVHVDRVRIWKNNDKDGELYCTQLYEWVGNVPPQQGNEHTIDVSYSKTLPEWQETLSAGKCINSIVSKMSDESIAQLKPQGIVSLLVVPVFADDKFWGFIGFDDCKGERRFTDEEESILRSCGMLFAEAMLRNEMIQNIRDKSDQLKSAMDTILENEERMRTMLDAMPFACRLIGRNFEFIDCNNEALKLVGVKTKEEYREKFDSIVPKHQPCGRLSNELKMEYLKQAFDEGYARFEWLYQTPDGKPLPCEVTMVRVFSKGEQIIAAYARDLREQKAVIEEMRRAEIAEESNKAKSRFLANMSHEIRTPMNSIVGFTELALDDDISPRTRHYLNNIHENSEGLLHIINDILDISKIESGKMELECVPFDPHELFAACRTMIMPKAIDKGLKMHFYAEPPPGKKPMGDPTRLRQVLLNLLSNAVKFTDNGIIRLQASVRKMTDKDVTVFVEVKDTGIGMSEDQIEKLFTHFTQAESGTTRKYGGTGLGLAISKNLVEMMGGELNVESTPGVGSTFSFELVFKTIDIDEEGMFKEHTTVQGNLQKPTFEGEILLCEDNPMNQQVICEHLSRVGLRTVVAENGKIGLEKIQSRIENNEKQFDLVFMDMHMPEMDGLEAASKIKELIPDIPVVAMTANIMSSDKELYETSGMSGVVGKPFTSQELWRCLMKYFEPVNWQSENIAQLEQKNDELRKMLIKRFVDGNKKKYEEISQAINKSDFGLAHRLAHTLKSNAAQLHITPLHHVVLEVERNLKDGVNKVTLQQMKALETELKIAIEELEPHISDISDPPENNAISAKDAKLLLDDLEKVLIDSDPASMKYVDKLKLISGSEELIQLVEDFEYTDAIKALKKLRKSIKA